MCLIIEVILVVFLHILSDKARKSFFTISFETHCIAIDVTKLQAANI